MSEDKKPVAPRDNTYRNFIPNCLRTECSYESALGRLVLSPGLMRLVHGGMIVTTEGGELNDQIKKHLFYGKELDKVNLREEVGDVLYGLALVVEYLGDPDFTPILKTEIEKLRVRYPSKFTENLAINRDTVAERQVLEQKPITGVLEPNSILDIND